MSDTTAATPATNTASITITVPKIIYDALIEEGRTMNETPSEVLKSGLRLALKAREGWTLKLHAPPPVRDPNQPELFGDTLAATR